MPRARPSLDEILDPVARGLTGATPRPEPEPDQTAQLAHIAEVSKNARTTWFALIGLCLFVGVTLLGHKDADFFAYGAETQLPLVNVTIPVPSFFIFAPVLVAALYIYLHLYLMSLWDALADLEQKKGAAPIADRVYPWLISHAALWYRNRVRPGPEGKPPERSADPRALGWVVVAVSLALGWALGLIVLAGLWFRSLPAHEEWMTLWIAACLLAAAAVGYTGLRAGRARMLGQHRARVAATHAGRWRHVSFLAVLLTVISWEATEGSLFKYRVMTGNRSVEWRLFLYRADLREAALIAKPSALQSYDLWHKEFTRNYFEENGIDSEATLTPLQLRSFWASAKQNWAEKLAPLARLDLRGRDLRNADMTRAILIAADLRGARLDGAELSEARLQGADLGCLDHGGNQVHCASLNRARLDRAEMQGTRLSGAVIRRTSLREAALQGADLIGVAMHGADLSGARLQGADFRWAAMQQAKLYKAQMQGSILREAEMQDAFLVEAEMQGADLRGATIQGADLSRAQMQGADFGWAQLRGAILSEAQMQGAYLHHANLQKAILYNAVLHGADFRGVYMQEAELLGAQILGADFREAVLKELVCSFDDLRGVLLHSAILTCTLLFQEELEQAVGDSRTLLPEGLTVASCLEMLPSEVAAALMYYPEEGNEFRPSRAQIRDLLLCDRSADGNLIEHSRRVGRHPSPQQ